MIDTDELLIDRRDCPNCHTRMEQKHIFDSSEELWQCPNCKNIEINYSM